MVFVKNAETLRFELLNAAGEQLLGRQRRAMLGKSDGDFFPIDQVAFFANSDRGVLRNRRALDVPLEPVDTARGCRWLRTTKIPLFDQAGGPRHLLGISLDITDRGLDHAASSTLRAHCERIATELERQGSTLRLVLDDVARNALGPSDSLPKRSFDDLYDACGGVILRHCTRLLRDKRAGEDARQEVFLRALRHIEHWPPASEVRSWLLRIATNYCLNELRRGRVRAQAPPLALTSRAVSPEQCVVARSELKRVLARLPADGQEAVRLVYLEGWQQHEVADALGVSRRTVVSYLSRLRSRG